MSVPFGSTASLAFLFGDYCSQLYFLGKHSSAIYAGLSIMGITCLNAFGLLLSKWTQNLLTLAKMLGLIVVIGVGLAYPVTDPPLIHAVDGSPSGSYGGVIIFVLLTYGGWSEAAYLAAELQEVQRNMSRVLVIAIAMITGIFLLVNLAYLRILGLSTIAHSEVVAADLMASVLGEPGAQFIGLLIAISALGAINGTIWTGARTHYVWGH